VARILREALEHGRAVEIDGLGTFLPGRERGFRFVAQTKPRVFIAYVEEDLGQVKRLYDVFERHGLRPWLDKKKLLPGQNWPRAIETAIQTSDFFVACFSGRSTTKRGAFQSELRYALTCAARIPLDEIFSFRYGWNTVECQAGSPNNSNTSICSRIGKPALTKYSPLWKFGRKLRNGSAYRLPASFFLMASASFASGASSRYLA
jgi:TIR domain